MRRGGGGGFGPQGPAATWHTQGAGGGGGSGGIKAGMGAAALYGARTTCGGLTDCLGVEGMWLGGTKALEGAAARHVHAAGGPSEHLGSAAVGLNTAKQGCLFGEKKVRNTNRNEPSQGRSLLHSQHMDKTEDHKRITEQWLAVGDGWWLAVRCWRLVLPRGRPYKKKGVLKDSSGAKIRLD